MTPMSFWNCWGYWKCWRNLGFCTAYAYPQVPDAIFVGTGKTKYNTISSLICNIVYYGIWFILYKTGGVVMSMDMIIVMFGCGNITHWAVSLVEERVFLRKKIGSIWRKNNIANSLMRLLSKSFSIWFCYWWCNNMSFVE